MSPPAANSRNKTTAIVLVVVGLIVIAAAWMLPANLKSLSPTLLKTAGENTPTLGGFGRDLVDLEKIGPASFVLTAAKSINDPRAPALGTAIEEFSTRQPGVTAWGGWDPFLDPLFNLRAASERHTSTPVLTFFIPEKSRDKLRTYLANSGSQGVQSFLKLATLTKTGRFVPASKPGGQPLDSLILLGALLYQGERYATPLQRELRGLTDTALQKQDLGELEAFFLDLLSLGRRLDWTQLSELMRRTESVKTVAEFAHLARVAPDQLALIYTAALFSDSADRAAVYLIQFGKTGLDDLRVALANGQGAVKLLLDRQLPVNHDSAGASDTLASFTLVHPQVALVLKYFGYLLGVFLALRGLDRMLVGVFDRTARVPGYAHIKSSFLAILFAGLLIVTTEPFLLRAAPPSEFQFHITLPVLVAAGEAPPPEKSQPTATMDSSTLVSIGIFATLQIAMYFICLMKIRDISRQNISPLVKLRLMENEENLFDGGLYVGIAGTATALVLQVLRVIEPNLLAAYASNLFGIMCVALVKIRHVRDYKRQLILDAQAPGRITP